MRNVLIVGAGAVGTCLAERLSAKGGIETHFYQRSAPESRAPPSFLQRLHELRPKAVFIALSTKDDGTAAFQYIKDAFLLGIPAITCEKGSFANYAKELLKCGSASKIGYSAVVGAGNGMIDFVKNFNLRGRKATIQIVLNASLNYRFSRIQEGHPSWKVFESMRKLGIVEPGATDDLSCFASELNGDSVKKVCALYNIALARRDYLTPDQFVPLEYRYEDLDRLDQLGNCRLVFSFSNRETPPCYPYVLKHFESQQIEDWHVSGGFRRATPESDLLSWVPGGIGNAVRIDVEDDSLVELRCPYIHSGPGAGVLNTAEAMVRDFERIMRAA